MNPELVKLNNNIVKIIINIINSHEIYGFEILSIIKESNQKLDEALVYSTLKSLENKAYITTFKMCEDGNCCVKIRYRLTEKGQELLNTFIRL